VKVILQRTRSEELHLDKRVNWRRHAPCGGHSQLHCKKSWKSVTRASSQELCACVSRPTLDRAVRQDAREHITRFLEYKTTCRAPVRTCTELYGSATSVWVQVSPQSELMGPSSAGFALTPGIN
jgi:hypothetical protein